LKQELIGQQFERMLVISAAGRSKSKKSLWLCRCDCDVEKVVLGANLKEGGTRSCGCLHRELVSQLNTNHGQTNTAEYNIWTQAKQRCTNPNNKRFHDYGGRGVKFLFDDFEEFFAHIGPRPGKEYSLDRIDNSGNYEYGNVRWATLKIQSRNKRSNRYLSYRNETLCLTDWAKKLGFSYETIKSRVRSGWSVEQTLSTPIKVRA
jgi:hypothetical protein